MLGPQVSDSSQGLFHTAAVETLIDTPEVHLQLEQPCQGT
jgi:hypothetical protein